MSAESVECTLIELWTHQYLIVSFQHAQVGDQQNDYHQFLVCKIHPSHAEHRRARWQLPNSRSNKMLIEDQMIAKIENYISHKIYPVVPVHVS